MISSLSNENDDLQKENKKLKSEVYALKEKAKEDYSSKDFSKEKQILSDKVKYLETTLYKCVNGKEKLDAILEK